MQAIVEQTFPSRIEAIAALRAAPPDADRLRRAAARAAEISDQFGLVDGAKNWQALAAGLRIAAHLTDWETAVVSAEMDADRHLRAARQLLKQLSAAEQPTEYQRGVVDGLSRIIGDVAPEDVGAIRAALAGAGMPVAIIADPAPATSLCFDVEENRKPEDLAVAFLEFTINGTPAADLHALRPGQVHDLDLVIRVSHWPQEADSLAVSPVSIEPQSIWELPRFSFARPAGPPPYVFQREGRMVIQVPQGFAARPLEFVYAAEFQPSAGNQRVVIAGQRRLRLDGIDPTSQAITGYGNLDRRLLEIREQLRRQPMIAEDEIRNLLTVLAPLANLAGVAIQDALYPKPIGEAEFEADIRQRLRVVPAIGAELEQQAQVAGGRTDLSFRGIRIELKSEKVKRLLPKDCKAFANQAVSYAVGSGKRIAILCVLDCSPKTFPPFPAEEGFNIEHCDSGGGAVLVVTLLIQGGLAKPSSFSR